MTDAPKNVALLSIDALRADHLSGHGYGRGTTPELDDFAGTGARFKRAYSQSSHTREAVPSLLTGRYPTAAVGEDYRLSADTVATRLDAASRDIAAGAFHSNPFVSRAYGFDRGFDAFDDDLRFGRHRLLALAQRLFDKLRDHHYARAETINERSLKWLDQVADDGRDWFLWNHYMDAHGPYEPPAEYQRLFRDETVTDQSAQRLYKRAISDPSSIDEGEQQTLIDLYDAEIRYVDDQISAFVGALEERGLLSETLVVVTADHGDAFGEHGYYEHPRYVHDELVHIPLIVFGAGVGDETISVPAGIIDVVPTILEVFGVDEEELPGVSLLDLVQNPSAYEGRVVYSQARGEDDNGHLRRFSARNDADSCYLERNVETGAVAARDQNGAPDRLTERLMQHSEHHLDSDDEPTRRTDTVGAVEDRLEALGYKE